MREIIVNLVMDLAAILILIILAFAIYMTYKEFESGSLYKHFNSNWLTEQGY